MDRGPIARGRDLRKVSFPRNASLFLVPSSKAVTGASSALIVVAGASRCALPLEHVIETMRPLPIEPVADAPAHVLGLSIIRGRPVPVVDLGGLLASSGPRAVAQAPARFVTVRAGTRQVALAVQSVVGVKNLGPNAVHELPPLVGASPSTSVTALGVLDRELLSVLDAARVIPEEWSG
jgi:purine-binding chemotaxis protein CheW